MEDRGRLPPAGKLNGDAENSRVRSESGGPSEDARLLTLKTERVWNTRSGKVVLEKLERQRCRERVA